MHGRFEGVSWIRSAHQLASLRPLGELGGQQLERPRQRLQLPEGATDGASVTSLFRRPEDLLIWLPIGILGGGVVEELQRIFILTRFEKWLGRPGLALALLISSAMFGVGHLYQGLASALATAVSGLVFALVYLRRRSALEPITAHASSDVLAMFAATILATD